MNTSTLQVFADRAELYRHVLPVGGLGLEIGVDTGANAVQLLRAAQPARLHLVDPWCSGIPGTPRTSQQAAANHERVLRRFRHQVQHGRVVIWRGFSQDLLPKFPAGSLDFVYVDGDHTYQAVRRDIALALRVLRPGGILAGHDLTTSSRWGIGVIAAVLEIVPAVGPVIGITDERHPSWAIRVKSKGVMP